MSARPRILIADDDVELRAILSRHLTNRGAEVIEAEDGDQALSRLRADHPHLVLLDVMMPGHSGWEVAKRIRDDDALRGTGILMLTGIGEALNAMTAPIYGADERLDKPFAFDDLDARITQVLGYRHPGVRYGSLP